MPDLSGIMKGPTSILLFGAGVIFLIFLQMMTTMFTDILFSLLIAGGGYMLRAVRS